MTSQNIVVDESAPGESTPPPEMQEALGLVQRIGGHELLSKVVRLFRTSAEERLLKLEDAMAAGDTVQVSRLAHAMKGSAAQVGAEPLRALASALEQEASSLDHATLLARLAFFSEAVARACVQLEAYREAIG